MARARRGGRVAHTVRARGRGARTPVRRGREPGAGGVELELEQREQRDRRARLHQRRARARLTLPRRRRHLQLRGDQRRGRCRRLAARPHALYARAPHTRLLYLYDALRASASKLHSRDVRTRTRTVFIWPRRPAGAAAERELHGDGERSGDAHVQCVERRPGVSGAGPPAARLPVAVLAARV